MSVELVGEKTAKEMNEGKTIIVYTTVAQLRLAGQSEALF